MLKLSSISEVHHVLFLKIPKQDLEVFMTVKLFIYIHLYRCRRKWSYKLIEFTIARRCTQARCRTGVE